MASSSPLGGRPSRLLSTDSCSTSICRCFFDALLSAFTAAARGVSLGGGAISPLADMGEPLDEPSEPISGEPFAGRFSGRSRAGEAYESAPAADDDADDAERCVACCSADGCEPSPVGLVVALTCFFPFFRLWPFVICVWARGASGGSGVRARARGAGARRREQRAHGACECVQGMKLATRSPRHWPAVGPRDWSEVRG